MTKIRDWEQAMLATGAVRLRVATSKKGEYVAEAVVARGLVEVTGEDMETVCTRLLERCQEEAKRNGIP
jgi:hypothetical protein